MERIESPKKVIKNQYMIKIEQIPEINIEHKEEVIQRAKDAIKYLKSFAWCDQITGGWLVKDFGYILCIFYFEIKPAENSDADDKIWIIVGDIPSAYLDTIEYKTANEALDFYCFLMDEWVEHVKNGQSIQGCYPVNVTPTLEHAAMLESRINLIKSDFLPYV